MRSSEMSFIVKLNEFLRISEEYKLSDASYQSDDGEFEDCAYTIDRYDDSESSKRNRFTLESDQVCLCGYDEEGMPNCKCPRTKRRSSSVDSDGFKYLKYSGINKQGKTIPRWAVDNKLLGNFCRFQKKQPEYTQLLGNLRPEKLLPSCEDDDAIFQ
ncbi:unnamed protein product [Moneuplotes crassus]|uniref:Uncharacterized protein n=1 Tax=Euplotes crassus TaxID=5936 RepID=A0AAD1UJ81_EUPCR|nr:unnamed protein product [Moneuplotes crassus]